MMKKLVDKILVKALERLFALLLDALERWLKTDLDGDGKIGGEDVKPDDYVGE